MTQKKFKLWNSLVALGVFLVSAVTYLSTIEPTASYWDCGEFIASSYKLEVGHPPGNPVFQLFARIFTIFGDKEAAAPLVNSFSALCSALTILFLYLTIVFFAKRLVSGKKEDGGWSLGSAIAIMGSGAVGALAYTFTDTFWFSAVEGEVYAMSSLMTALVLWLMCKWYEDADGEHSGRWIVLISFVMGLSIGIHLLNLLMIPSLVYLYYYKKGEGKKFTFWEMIKIFMVGVVILAVILFAIIPYLPKLAAYFDLFFVNVLGLPYNSGAAFFMLALLAGCFWALFFTQKRQKAFANTVLLCFTTIVIGFSLFAIDVIRSSAKTPTNEYQPDNAFTLVRYLSREQYGKTPLIYGQYFDAPAEGSYGTYWAPVDGKYKKVDSPVEAKYSAEGKMLFPRMWSSAENHKEFYLSYTHDKGRKVKGAEHRKPTMIANLAFFFDFQMNWMYWRYFMWNFVGRQNDIHSPAPGELFHGNWESGISFIDNMLRGDQSDAPAILSENKGKNHYYFLPLLLGLIGLFFQFDKDKRGCWVVFLTFFMTGIAIVLYLNQPPYQVRERDYAYAGSFYAFSIWIGFAVAAISEMINKWSRRKSEVVVTSAVTAACLCVPVIMAAENWDDHDRSNRYTAVEMAKNYLNSVGPNGIIVTHGDNDTFPLWYAQEVEEFRNDVRVVNTSLLGTDWHIDQMKWAVNESAPLDLKVGQHQYIYGANDWIPIYDRRDQVIPLKDVMEVFRHPDATVVMSSGKKLNYICSRRFSIPVNKENVIKYGILDAKYYDLMPDEIVLELPAGASGITKPELFFLDFLSNYQWDRPLHFLSMGGDINVGVKEYFQYEGYSYKFTPIRNNCSSSDAGFVDTDHLYKLMTENFTWDALARDDYFIDYQNLFTHLGVMPVRTLFMTCAKAFIKAGEYGRALEMLDKCREVTAPYPVETVSIGLSGNDLMVADMASYYYALGRDKDANEIASELANELFTTASFYLEYIDYAKSDFTLCCQLISYLNEIVKNAGDNELSDAITENLNTIVQYANR